MEKQQESLRMYFFTNMYTAGIHAGIQAQHCTADMFVKHDGYEEPNLYEGAYTPQEISKHEEELKVSAILFDWAHHHKTTILLNGGYHSNLLRITELLSCVDNPYPWSYFCESKEALNGAMTSVGVVVPEKVYNAVDIDTTMGAIHNNGIVNLTTFERRLAKEIRQCNLMG
jgi:hypothetical protein